MPGNSANSFRPYAAARTRWSGSARIRAIRLLYEVSPATAVALGFFTLACGILPVLALVSFGFATGRIPGALARALSTPAGIAHLEDQARLDQVAVASGELSGDGPADAPITLAVTMGSR